MQEKNNSRQVEKIKKSQTGKAWAPFLTAMAVGLVASGLFCTSVYVFAVYGPGETLSPTCAPGTSGCTVKPPLTDSFTNDFAGTGDITTTGSFRVKNNNTYQYFGANDEAKVYFDGTQLVIVPGPSGTKVLNIGDGVDSFYSLRFNTSSNPGTFQYTGSTKTFDFSTDDGNILTVPQLRIENSGGVVYTFPTADGTEGQYLKTNGSGDLSWGSVDVSGYVPYTGASQSLNLGNYSLYSSSIRNASEILAVDLNNRRLYNSGGLSYTLDWGAGTLRGNDSETSLDWLSRILYDGNLPTSRAVFEWGNRVLKFPDGTTAMNFATNRSINFGSSDLSTTGSITAASFSGSGVGLTGVVAGSADYANTAGSCSSADYASTAGSCSSADYATTAGYVSGSVSSADYATQSGSADYASSCGSCSSTSYADSAGSCSSASYASNAGYADYAGSVSSADYATTAGSVDYASSAGYVTGSIDSGQISWNGPVGIGQDVTITGNLRVTGKLDVEGLIDPPGALFDPQTRQQISERAGDEIPLAKKIGATMFFNVETQRMELFIPTEGKFYDLFGNVLQQQTPQNQLARSEIAELNNAGQVGSGEVSGVSPSSSNVKDVASTVMAIMESGITKIKSLIAEKITVDVARIKKMEMVDDATGEIYCTWIQNGEWQKTKGECSPVNTSDTENEQTIVLQEARALSEQIKDVAKQVEENQEAVKNVENVVQQVQDIVNNSKEMVESTTNTVTGTATPKVIEDATPQVIEQATPRVIEEANKKLSAPEKEVSVPEQAEETKVEGADQASIGNLIQSAAAGLINSIMDFTKWIFGTPAKKVSSMPQMKSLTHGVSQDVEFLGASLLKPISNLFKR